MNDTYTRVISEARFTVINSSTVRQTAKAFGISKSTVHKDLTEKLFYFDRELYEQVKKVLKINLNERHIRGGEATRQKYKKKRLLKIIGES